MGRARTGAVSSRHRDSRPGVSCRPPQAVVVGWDGVERSRADDRVGPATPRRTRSERNCLTTHFDHHFGPCPGLRPRVRSFRIPSELRRRAGVNRCGLAADVWGQAIMGGRERVTARDSGGRHKHDPAARARERRSARCRLRRPVDHRGPTLSPGSASVKAAPTPGLSGRKPEPVAGGSLDRADMGSACTTRGTQATGFRGSAVAPGGSCGLTILGWLQPRVVAGSQLACRR
jgi:hypothetical protein